MILKIKVEKKLFIPSLIILIIVIVAVATNLNALQQTVDRIYNGCIDNFGWLFVFTNICCLLFSIWLMFGKYKNVRLGGEDCKPAFSTFSWAGMMFTTSCGAWLIVYGFLEPIYCASQDILLTEGMTSKIYEYGQMYAHFHWGPNAWCIYVPISVAIGYALYNREGKGITISEGIRSVTDGKRWGKTVGYIADIVAICGVVIAPVISIGTGMPLLVVLVQNIFGLPDVYQTGIQIGILCVWILIFGTSVYLGLQKGIKHLSNINVLAAFAFMGVVGLVVGLIQVFSSEINTVGNFLSNFVRMSTYTDPYGDGSFVKGWTFGYWACYFVYMPLMGVFNARISKGRKLKEIAMGQLVLCTLGCWVAMGTFGNYAIKLQTSGKVDVAAFLAKGDEAGAILALAEQMPIAKAFMIVLLIISFVFLATTMDSSAFVAAEMTAEQNGKESLAPRWLRVVWAVVASVIAFVLLQVGGAKAVRSLCYIAGLPLAIITYFVFASVYKMLKEDHGEAQWWSKHKKDSDDTR